MVYIDTLLTNRENLTEWEVKSLYFVFISTFFKNASFYDDDQSVNRFFGENNRRRLFQRYGKHNDKDGATKCKVSEAFLISYFKKYVSCGFKEFVNGLLINKALDCFSSSPKLSITEIALKSGFGSVRNFNRIFFSVMGCTPSQYRKKSSFLSCESDFCLAIK